MKNTEEILEILIHTLSEISEIKAIGMSGSKTPLPKAEEGDMDLFIYCDKIPSTETRRMVLEKMDQLMEKTQVGVFEEGHWGIGDFGTINGVETWLMYFTEEEALKEVESILYGENPDKVDNYYYPVGRCAMLKDINVLLDRDSFLDGLKKRLCVYPEELAGILLKYHFDELEDVEDMERAVTRKDVLFYHFALDIGIDHFLQAIFAMNKTFFPSRKRTLQLMEGFHRKPKNCEERLLKVIKLGGEPEGIEESYNLFCELIKELKVKGVNENGK